MIQKVLFYNPWGGIYLRGEDRAQEEVKHSFATVVRPPNDLGYMAAVLRNMSIKVMIQDYMAEQKKEEDFINELHNFKPDMIVCSMVDASIINDLKTFSLAKKINPSIITVAKGSYFFSAQYDEETSRLFAPMDYALVGECGTIIDKLVSALNKGEDISTLKGLIWKQRDTYISNGPAEFVEDLDSIPFPSRDLMNNRLYVRPDTGKPQATIQVDRGCEFQCTFCMSPIISGNKVRHRSITNIIEEINECVHKFRIHNFFFRSDNFTSNREFVLDFCEKIIQKKLKIKWVANSRVNPIDIEMLKKMKQAGCWLMAYGLESGNEKTLKRIRKGHNVQHCIDAVNAAKKVGLRTYVFFIIGFPWENKEHIEETIRLAKRIKADYYEFHICVLYKGTPLYEEFLSDEFYKSRLSSIGLNRYTTAMGTKHLSGGKLLAYRIQALREICLSPSYIAMRFIKVQNFRELWNNFRYGIRFLKSNR